MSVGDADVADEASGRLARLGPGVAVGEMALVGDSGRSAKVVAVQDTVVAELSTAAIEACAAAHSGLLTHLHVNLARVLADRLRRANDQLRRSPSERPVFRVPQGSCERRRLPQIRPADRYPTHTQWPLP
jgi:CRP-like cAMP-binding protein